MLSWLILALLAATVLASSQVIAFGSCLQFYQSQRLTVFNQILKERPSDFIFLGDMLYLDRYVSPSTRLRIKWQSETDRQFIVHRIRTLYGSPEIQMLRAIAKVHFVWDDHDYNCNNCGSENPVKEMMLDIFRK